MPVMERTNGESGNALWFIMLAIALLAALTVTISRSSETTEQVGDVERQRVLASAIMRTAASVQQAVEQMRLKGVSENEISFENEFTSGYANSRCAGDSCKIFHVKGGGLTYKGPPDDANDGGQWLFSGANNVEGAGTDGTGPTSSTDNELLMILPGVAPALCGRINTELGISGIPQDAGKSDVATFYTGTFPDGETIDAAPGKKTACYQGDQNGGGGDISDTYYFYHTLVVR